MKELEIRLPRREEGQTYASFMRVFEEVCRSFHKQAIKSTIEFVAGCIRLAAPDLPRITRESAETSYGDRNRQITEGWRRRAEFANAVVSALVPTWGSDAFILYDFFAGLIEQSHDAQVS